MGWLVAAAEPISTIPGVVADRLELGLGAGYFAEDAGQAFVCLMVRTCDGPAR